MAPGGRWLIYCLPGLVQALIQQTHPKHHPHKHQQQLAQQDAPPGAPPPNAAPASAPLEAPASEARPSPEIQLAATGSAVEAELTPLEIHNLLQGSHFNHEGWYIGNTGAVERLHLPNLNMQDAGNGFRNTMAGTEGTTIAWPCALALASTWDEDLVYDVASAIGREFRGKGSNVMLGPAVNVHRVARNGRNFEYLSGEDPYLGSRLTGPFVRAVQREGVMATIKHFAFNEQETLRDSEDSQVDDVTAWQLYYPPFEAGVQAGAGAVMCSYNRVNGTYACHNPGLLMRDLRGTMGFRGMVMSDWGAMHGTDAVAAGCDVEMPGRDMENGVEGHLNGKAFKHMDPRVLRAASEHVRRAIVMTGIDRNAEGCGQPCFEKLKSNQITEDHIALARRAATDSVVLLKNQGGFLPLGPGSARRLAVLGAASDYTETSGSWDASYFSGGGSSHSYGRPLVTALNGIQKRAAKDKMEVVHFSDSQNIPASLDAARGADIVVVVGATTSAEGEDRASLGLDSRADELIFRLAELQKPTVVLMQTPGAVLTPWRNESHVRAIANVFLGGEQTGNAWAALLFGDTNPGGKLPVMFPDTEQDTIAPRNETGVSYSEGMFTSYRSESFKAAYPFGHGLSYTTFEYGAPALADNCTAKACVRFSLTNTGARRGAEIAQAYLRVSGWDDLQPERTLKGFQKVWLDPKESKDVTLAFTERDMSIYRRGAWALQKKIDVLIGASSANIMHTIHLVNE